MKTKALITVTIVFAALGALHAADQLNPAITFDGSNFLVVWQEMGPDSMNGVYGKRVDIAGNAIDQQTFRISPADNNAGAPGITYGTEYFVTWVDQKADSIRCARVSSSGTVLDNTITIPEIQTYGTKKASIAFDGTNYLLPYVFHYPFYCALLSQSGSILSSQRLMSSDCSEGAQVIFGSENYLVVWKDFG